MLFKALCFMNQAFENTQRFLGRIVSTYFCSRRSVTNESENYINAQTVMFLNYLMP